jgi:hypothetical protein
LVSREIRVWSFANPTTTEWVSCPFALKYVEEIRSLLSIAKSLLARQTKTRSAFVLRAVLPANRHRGGSPWIDVEIRRVGMSTSPYVEGKPKLSSILQVE